MSSQALIEVTERSVGDESVQTVNARDLHVLLNIGKDFSNWIKAQIERARLVEARDFAVFEVSAQKGENQSGGRPAKEYALTLDAAKHIAMMSGSEKGFEVREYFLECERAAKSNVVDIHRTMNDPAALRTMLLGYTEKVIALETKVAADRPKVEMHDRICEAINGQTVQEVAKVLGTGQNRLFRWLREHGLLMRNNQPYQEHLDAERFRVVERQYTDAHGESHTYIRTLVTGKGLAYIQSRFHAEAA